MWTTIVELEFWHLMKEPATANDDETRLAPTPDFLHANLNSGVKELTRNGLLVWLWDGTVVHAQWLTVEKQFVPIKGGNAIPMAEIRAWSALPMPIAVS